MIFALILTILGSICMALMIVTDRLMISDCYKGNAKNAWIVSAIAGCLFGLLLTTVVWIAITQISSTVVFGDILETSKLIFFPYGILMITAGALSIQVLYHYFRCYSENAQPTIIASWIAATPIFVFITSALLYIFEKKFETGLIVDENFNFNFLFLVGVIVATVGLIVFESISNTTVASTRSYLKDLSLMLLCNIVSILLIQQILIQETGVEPNMYLIALLPYFWIGFLFGTRPLLNRIVRNNFLHEWRETIQFSLYAILFVEIIGMLVFFLEYFSLSLLDPSFMSILIGSHILVVYLFEKLLIKYKIDLGRDSVEYIYFFGFKIHVGNLPDQHDKNTRLQRYSAILLIVGGISIATFYII